MSNNLHEQYQTLLRRGMPEVPDMWTDGHGKNKNFITSVPGIPGYEKVYDDQQARDLIEAQARRWFVSLDTTKVLIDGSERMVRHALALLAEHTANGHGVYIPDGLDAILAATAHLEPK